MFTESTCKYILCCKSKKMKRHIEIYNKGVAKIEDDFDMHNYAGYMRDLKNIKKWVTNF